jgi:glyoxylase-like metal-dependent hydrolase (beta-lactamase superfamily II)
MAVRTPEIVAPGVLLVPLRTPTLPPATHTNCVIVGDGRLALIEPATPYPDEQRRLDAELDRLAGAGRRIEAILVTHHHADHVGYAAALRDRLGVPLYAHPETAARAPFPVDRLLDDGAVVDLGGGVALEAVFTPGHAPGHLVFLERRSGVVVTGDLVAGEGTIVVDPADGGDMVLYLDSLARLDALHATALVPGHGPVLPDAGEVIARYVAHRQMRERKVLEAIGERGATLGEVLARAYDDTPMWLWPLAARSLEAHLVKLEREGCVERAGDQVKPAADRTTS